MFDSQIRRAKAKAAAFMASRAVDGPDQRGQVNNAANAVIGLVIALTVGAIVAAFLLPIGVDELVGVDVTAWSSGAQALWGILDVIIVLALFLFFIAVALAASNKV